MAERPSPPWTTRFHRESLNPCAPGGAFGTIASEQKQRLVKSSATLLQGQSASHNLEQNEPVSDLQPTSVPGD